MWQVDTTVVARFTMDCFDKLMRRFVNTYL